MEHSSSDYSSSSKQEGFLPHIISNTRQGKNQPLRSTQSEKNLHQTVLQRQKKTKSRDLSQKSVSVKDQNQFCFDEEPLDEIEACKRQFQIIRYQIKISEREQKAKKCQIQSLQIEIKKIQKKYWELRDDLLNLKIKRTKNKEDMKNATTQLQKNSLKEEANILQKRILDLSKILNETEEQKKSYEEYQRQRKQIFYKHLRQRSRLEKKKMEKMFILDRLMLGEPILENNSQHPKECYSD